MNWPLIINILLFYSILIIVNIPAPFIGLEFESETKPRLWYQPPGFVIPIAWFVLFTLLGTARYELMKAGQDSATWLLILLAVLCAAYAYYTLGLAKLTGISALWFGLWGNLVVIVFAIFVALRLWPDAKVAACLVLPVSLWTAYATLIVLGEMKQQALI
jgi:tryptophan-rich sensory protein